MRVAVTGARGFIGGHVVKELQSSQHEVVSLGRIDESGRLGRVDVAVPEALCGDLEESLQGVSAVIHLAGQLHVGRGGQVRDYLQANVVATEAVLQAAIGSGARRFIFASTRLVYPPNLSGSIGEEVAREPADLYGASKSMAEDVVRIESKAADILGLSLRICQVMGPGDQGRGVLPTFIDEARSGNPIEVLGKGDAIREFVDVRDVARAFVLAIDAVGISSTALNVGGPGAYAVRELATRVAQEAGIGTEMVRFKAVDHEDRSGYWLDSSAAAEQLGWSPKLGIERIIRDRMHG